MIRADRVLLATGFDTTRPGGDMVDQLIANEALACANAAIRLSITTSLGILKCMSQAPSQNWS